MLLTIPISGSCIAPMNAQRPVDLQVLLPRNREIRTRVEGRIRNLTRRPRNGPSSSPFSINRTTGKFSCEVLSQETNRK